MTPAGVKQYTSKAKGISDVWNLGSQYKTEQRRVESNQMNAKDINGEIKRNQFGAKMILNDN